VKYGFIRAHQDQFRVSRMCVVLQVSRNGYYDWRDRPESKRSKENRIALSQIREVHARSREAYGAFKTWQELMARGFQWGRHRIAKLRQAAGIEAKRKRRFRITTQSRAGVVAARIGLSNDLKPRRLIGSGWEISHSYPRPKDGCIWRC
jgi:putative transposase